MSIKYCTVFSVFSDENEVIGSNYYAFARRKGLLFFLDKKQKQKNQGRLMQPYNAAPTSQNPAEQRSFHSQLNIFILDFLKNGFTSEYPYILLNNPKKTYVSGYTGSRLISSGRTKFILSTYACLFRRNLVFALPKCTKY